jgi:hypothetical protein
MRKSTVFVAAAILSPICLAQATAQNVVGKWTGKITGQLPKGNTPEQQKQMAQAQQMMSKLRLVMTINADKTYTVKASGVNGQDTTTNGSWVIKNGKLSLTDVKRNGKAVPKDQQRAVELSMKNGKLSSAIPGAPAGISIIFSKG